MSEILNEIAEEPSLPEDIDTCHALLRDLHAAYTRLQQIYSALLDTCRSIKEGREKLEQEKEKLELTVKELTRRLYGRKSERRTHDPNQKWLDFGEDAPAVAELDPEADRTRTSRGRLCGRLQADRRRQ